MATLKLNVAKIQRNLYVAPCIAEYLLFQSKSKLFGKTSLRYSKCVIVFPSWTLAKNICTNVQVCMCPHCYEFFVCIEISFSDLKLPCLQRTIGVCVPLFCYCTSESISWLVYISLRLSINLAKCLKSTPFYKSSTIVVLTVWHL